MSLTNIKAITIPEGKVSRILSGDKVLWSAGLIPSAYQQVEYIATDGNQIIDTLVIPSDHKDGIWYELDFRSNWDGSLNSNDYVWGCISGASRSGNLYYNRSAGNSRLVCGTTLGGITYNWYDITTRTIVRVFATSEDTSSLRLEYEQNGEVKNPTVNSSRYDTAPMPSESIYLFNCRGISRQGTPIVCYGFSMKAADKTPIRNFIPCYRKSDGVIGLYDTVERRLHTNIGTGSFMKGPDVSNNLPDYTNQLPISIDTDGSIYNGKGFKENSRLESSGTIGTKSGQYVTGFIPISIGSANTARGEQVIYLQDVTAALDANLRVGFYKSDKTFIALLYGTNLKTEAEGAGQVAAIYTKGADGNVNTIDVTGITSYYHNANMGDVGYFRLSTTGISDNSIITVNEPIE